MPNSIHRLENFTGNKTVFAQKGITTDGQKYEWFKNEYITVDKTRDELSAFFAQLFPGQNLIIPEDQVQRRMVVSENARHEYILLGIEMDRVKIPGNPPRHIGPFFRLETDEAGRAYNARLGEAIMKNEYDKICAACEEFLQDLPSYDPEELLSLSDEELPRVFREIYPAYNLSQETEKLLRTVQDPLTVYLREHLSEEAKQRLAALEKDMTLLSKLKLRCDIIADPHYAYIDTDKIVNNFAFANTLLNSNATGNLPRSLSNLSMGVTFSNNALGREVQLRLEKAGFYPDDTKVRDSLNREFPKISDCKEALNRGDTLFCTSGKKLKAFSLKEGNLVEQDPAAALDQLAVRTDAAMKQAGSILTGRVADPFWMLTGSSQYRGMKAAYANYQKLAAGGAENQKTFAALEKLETSALDYLHHKKVDLTRFRSFEAFTHPVFGNSPSESMSKRELARIEAAYSLLEGARNKLGALKLRQELGELPALAKEQMHHESMFARQDGKSAPTRAERVAELNENIRRSPLLSETVAEVGGDNTADALRQDINDALFAPEKGLLQKKVFTAQDRRLVETVLAKAVVLDIIRIGRKTGSDSPALTGEAYKTSPEGVLNRVKQSEAFRSALGKHMSPDGLRSFLAQNRHSSVSKNFLNPPAKQKDAAHTLQKDPQPTLEQKPKQITTSLIK